MKTKNLDKRAYIASYRKRPDFKVRHRQYTRNERARIRKAILAAYGHQCQCCGETRSEFLALDHKNGGGHKDRRRLKSSTQQYREVIKLGFPDSFQLLCHNCNCSKGWYGYCPHERDEI